MLPPHMAPAGQALLKTLALTVALLFLFGAMITSVTDLFGSGTVRTLLSSPQALAAGRANGDAGVLDAGPRERTFFPATKSAPLPRFRQPDGGAPTPVFFPASKSAGGEFPGLAPQPQQPTQQNAP